MARYVEACDIRSLVNTSLNLKILLSILLNDAQKVMFLHQRQRAIFTKSKFCSENSDHDRNSIINSFLVSDEFKGKLMETMSNFQTKDQMDRKLLMGILDLDPSQAPKPEKKRRMPN